MPIWFNFLLGRPSVVTLFNCGVIGLQPPEDT